MLWTKAETTPPRRSARDRQLVENSARRIEVVVPFTTLRQVKLALRRAEQLCSGLDAVARVIRVVVVPFPLDLYHPAVRLASVVHEMESLRCRLPVAVDLVLSRDLLQPLIAAVPENSLPVLVSRRRPWRTKEEKLARSLKQAGFEVVLSYEANQHA